MKTLFDREFILLVIFITTLFSGLLLFLIFYIKRLSNTKSEDRYDRVSRTVEIEYMRNNLEMKLYDISRKLEETENRWKDVNHLIITAQNNSISSAPIAEYKNNSFLKSMNINLDNLEIDNSLVFVLTPFNKQFQEAFFMVKKVCEGLKFRCIRGDEEFVPNDILPEILKQMLRARFIVVNISGRNANVMYELGIAHALGKNVIVIAENFTEIPFDLNNKRLIMFESMFDLKIKLEESLKDLLLQHML